MDLKNIYEMAEDDMSKAIKALKSKLVKIRTGKANLALLDDIKVDYYGQETPLKHIGSLSKPEPRMIMIRPWEENMLDKIEKAILASDVGITPQNDGKVIRLVFPSLTEERRKELVTKVKNLGEEAKIAVRNSRREYNDEIKRMEKESEISEDNAHIAYEEMQDITDEFTDKIDKLINKKEKEIMEI